MSENEIKERMIHEECGVFGVYNQKDAASLLYYGLHSLQHRGQEASGMAISNGKEITVVKGSGLTVDVFEKDSLSELNAAGNYGIGHVRYSTAGGNEYENIQPVKALSSIGELAIVHNGQIVNDLELKAELESKGCMFQGTSDSEIILHLILQAQGTLAQRVASTARKLVGGFAFLVLNGDEIAGARDPYGLKPLCYTKYQNGYLISSESCAFEVMGIMEFEDVLPGEVISFERSLIKKSSFLAPNQKSLTRPENRHLCAMEYIYFARPDSLMDGISIHAFRKQCGKILAEMDQDLDADIVVGVPDSSLSAAMGYAEQSGLPFECGLVKNPFVTRTFIQPTQEMRAKAVRLKLSAVSDVLKDKKVVMIDDSIVRGTTSARIVSMLKDAGAKEVHVRIASPKLISPCLYGVDISTKKELIAASHSVEEICDYIEADSLKFMSEEQLLEAAGNQGLCLACFNGNYCTDLFSHQKALESD